MEEFSRTELLINKEGLTKLNNACIIVFGIGGVGGYVVEALVRAGIGEIHLVDHDFVSVSNINRQIIAMQDTVGLKKVDVMKERIANINPNCKVVCYDTFFLEDTVSLFDFTKYDYIVDAIDTITAKLKLIEIANDLNIPIISSMGTGNKLDPTKLEVTDITKTSICPLARVMRRELKKRNIKHLKVVYSTEKPIETNATIDPETKKKTPGSISFVPSCAGLMLASVVVNELINK